MKIEKIVKILAYPVLMFSGIIMLILSLKFQLNFSLANGLFLGWTLLYLAILERVIPYEKAWHPTANEWIRDGYYLLITMIGGGCAAWLAFFLASIFTWTHFALPPLIEAFIALVLSSLGSYFFHRFSHVHPWLWRIHGIHHVESKVNVGNNGVNHILDVFCRRLCAQLPLVFLGFSPTALFILSIFNIVQGYFVHANVDVLLGWFNYVVVSPEQHRLHHSKDLQEAGHYSVDIPLWDLLLRTFTWYPGRKPQVVGVVDPQKFPLPNAIIASFLNPWRKHTPLLKNDMSTKPNALERLRTHLNQKLRRWLF